MHVVARPRRAAPEPDAPRRRLGLPSPRVAVSALAVLLVGAACAAFVGTGGAAAPAADLSRCNGLAALCDRPLDQVTFPATHNAMSVPLPGWFSAIQERPVGLQLQDGVRGLLLDTHDADRLDNGRVRTFFATPADLSAAIRQDGVSPESEAAALRLRDRLGFRGEGERGLYLCHTFCEIGATPLADGARRHPRLPRHAPRRGPRDRQPGRGRAGRHRPRGGRGGPGPLRDHAARGGGGLAHARRAGRAGPPAAARGGERGGRRAVVPARLRPARAGDAVRVPDAPPS